MADVRVAPNMVLSDGTTLSQLAAVSAAGQLSVSLTASSATVTVDTEMPAAAALADATANPSTSTLGAATLTFNGTTWDRRRSVVAAQDTVGTGIAAAGVLGQLDDTATAAVTENQFAPLRISTRRALLVEGVAAGTAISTTVSGTVTVDSELPSAAALADATANPTTTSVGSLLLGFNGTTWDRLRSTTANGLAVDVTRVTGTVTVDSELPAAAALADATANPTVPGVGGFLMGFNGTTWDRVRTANTGRLQVDVISGGGADTPTNPINNYSTAASIAAGATSNHDTVDFGAATKKVSKVLFGASVPLKVELQYVDNGVATTLAVGFSPAGNIEDMEPKHRNYWSRTFTANAGFDGFRVVRTNLDPSEAADVYSTIMYED